MSALGYLASLLRSNAAKAAKYIDDRFAALEAGSGVTTAAAVGLTSASSSGAGSGDALAKATHTHAITALDGRSMAAIADKAAGALAGSDFGPQLELLLTIPAGATGDVDFTSLPFKVRILDVVARKVTTSADGSDAGQLQTGAGAAITNSMALNVAADALVRATSIAAANHEIAAAGTIRWRRTQSTNAACVVRVVCVRVS